MMSRCFVFFSSANSLVGLFLHFCLVGRGSNQQDLMKLKSVYDPPLFL